MAGEPELAEERVDAQESRPVDRSPAAQRSYLLLRKTKHCAHALARGGGLEPGRGGPSSPIGASKSSPLAPPSCPPAVCPPCCTCHLTSTRDAFQAAVSSLPTRAAARDDADQGSTTASPNSSPGDIRDLLGRCSAECVHEKAPRHARARCLVGDRVRAR